MHLDIVFISVFLVALFCDRLDASQLKLPIDVKDLYDPATLPDYLVTKHLVTESIDQLDILDYHNETHAEPESGRRFNKQLVLGYLTPWNNKGYDRAVKYARKFTHISPVWLQISPTSGNKFTISGTHDIDNGWVSRIRDKNPDIKIVPRVIAENFNQQTFTELLYDSETAIEFAKAVIQVLEKHSLDGAVLEIWQPMREDVARRALCHAIKTIAAELKKKSLEAILVLAPTGGQSGPGHARPDDIKSMADSVAAFSIMTYDHPLTYSKAGPIAPLQWVHDCLSSISPDKQKSLKRKILMGINHYGYDWNPQKGAEAILGSTFTEHLEKYRPQIEWDPVGREHLYTYKKDGVTHKVHFPTLKSLDERITLAGKLGYGVAVWELGQGLEYFFDLL